MPNSGTTTGALTPKPPKAAWKTPEQLNYLTSHMTDFVTHQTAGSLDRFWPRVFDGWYKQWPISPTPEAIKDCGSSAGAILKARSENNQVRIKASLLLSFTNISSQKIRTWFHNQARPTSKSSKSDLRLNQIEKRKLAPAQAYCTYAWDSGLREIVVARWEEHKKSNLTAQENVTVDESAEVSTSHIPIDFKLKIAKEVYDSLSPDEKKLVDDRREEDRKKLYRPIQEIEDIEERDTKLASHEL